MTYEEFKEAVEEFEGFTVEFNHGFAKAYLNGSRCILVSCIEEATGAIAMGSLLQLAWVRHNMVEAFEKLRDTPLAHRGLYKEDD